MAKAKTIFHCTACGAEHAKWAGQCPDCKAWNVIEEFRSGGAPSAARFSGYAGVGIPAPVRLAGIESPVVERLESGLPELDRVLGGGLVPGSVVLIGGDPGIGKSTLLLQALAHLASTQPCLYVTGEESLQQISLRARRLDLDVGNLECLTETSVERVLATVDARRPLLVVIDSIQTLFTEENDSAPGSVSQVRDTAAALVRYTKQHGCCMLLVGHVTKDGALAGPRVLEHMVDTVLYFESDSGSRYRIVRAVKNRFGTVNELGMFAMTGKGLKPVANPSAIFLTGAANTPGSAVTVMREGTRPLLLELQALVAQSHLANPRRVTLGLDGNRVAMLLAVLQRHAGLNILDQDVFLNVVGGLRLADTGSDLPALLAVVSSFRDRALPAGLASFGEVGLGGEIRPVFNGEERLREAAAHGFEKVLLPVANAPRKGPAGLELLPVKNVQEALEKVFG